MAEQGLLELVRRPSGGRAVLHAGELTYALACRPVSANRAQAYRACCHWLQDAFARAGLPLAFGGGAAGSSFGEAQQRSSCFATATAADLVHSDGNKRIGSAQLWRGPHLLQHGSLLLTPPAPLWKLVFGAAPPALAPLPWDGPALEQVLRHSAEQALCDGGLVEQSLSPEECQQIERMAPL